MEYNLQKTIEPMFAYIFPKTNSPRLTSTPANSCINPSIGQVTRLFSVYVPIYSRPSEHLLEKQIDNDQIGGGVNESFEGENSGSESFEVENSRNEKVGEKNQEKNDESVHKMDEGIAQSFQTPKIKTSVLKLSQKAEKNIMKSNGGKISKSKIIKHKFHVN